MRPFSAPVRVALISLAFSLLISVPVLLFVYHQTDTLFEQRVRGRIDDRQEILLESYRRGGTDGLVRTIQEEIDSETGKRAPRRGSDTVVVPERVKRSPVSTIEQC